MRRQSNTLCSSLLAATVVLFADALAPFAPQAFAQAQEAGKAAVEVKPSPGPAGELLEMWERIAKMNIDMAENFPEDKYGYKPTEIRTAYDALAIYVNKDNPLEKITLAQADAVFSKTRRRGGKNVATWGDLGLTGDWASRPMSLYGRNSASGTYGFFKEHVLQNGDYRDQVKEQPGSAAVVQGITTVKGKSGEHGFEVNVRFTDTLIREEGAWRLVVSHVTAIRD